MNIMFSATKVENINTKTITKTTPKQFQNKSSL
jgi:hypothetical protein